MSANLISTFFNGDTTTNSITALEQTMLRLYRQHDGMSYGNFVAGNTDEPNVLAGSTVVVNQSLYEFPSTDVIKVLNANGDSFSLGNAVDGDYYLVAVVSETGTCSVFARLASTVTVAGSPTYLGWYISGTQHRVLGGFTRTSAAVLIYTDKWRYQLNGFSNEGADYSFRVYSDGLQNKLKVSDAQHSLSVEGGVGQYATGIVLVATIDMEYQGVLSITADTAKYAIAHGGNSSATASGMGSFVVTLLDKSGAVMGYVGDLPIQSFGASTSCFQLHPGKYKIELKTSESSRSVTTTTAGRTGPVTMTTTYRSGLRVNSLSAKIINGLGAPKSKY